MLKTQVSALTLVMSPVGLTSLSWLVGLITGHLFSVPPWVVLAVTDHRNGGVIAAWVGDRPKAGLNSASVKVTVLVPLGTSSS